MTRVVHQSVNAPLPRNDGGHCTINACLLADIKLHQRHALDRLRMFKLANAAIYHTTCVGQRPCAGLPDSGRDAGDQNNLLFHGCILDWMRVHVMEYSSVRRPECRIDCIG
ncbi:hypothetical protein D3C71_1494010 [compost metagenome]